MGSRADFLIFKTSLAFIQLKIFFTKALILYCFDLEYHIQIETDASGYTIDGVLSQLSFKTGLAGQVMYKSNN